MPAYKSRHARRNKSTIAGIARGTPMAKKLAMLTKREQERRARITAEIEVWFNQFDENGDGRLQRDELRALLTWLHPSRPPTEQNLDFLIRKATAIESSSLTIPGNKDGDVSWHDVRPCVLDYGDYCKDQSYIDSVFQRFDSDLSGELDAEELLQLLRSIAPEEISVDMTDVEYVLQQFDLNSDGVIDRDELLPMLAKWAHIAFEKVEEQHALQEKGRRQWQMIAAEAKNVGGVIATGGERMLSLVQLARQAREKQVEVQSKWHLAADAAAPSSQKKLLKVVALAKQQIRLEKEASDAAERLAAAADDDGASADASAAASTSAALPSAGLPAAAVPPAATAAAAAAAEDSSSAVSAEESVMPALPSFPSKRGSSVRFAEGSAPIVPTDDTSIGLLSPKSGLDQALARMHSRSESNEFAGADRDRAWEPTDRLNLRKNTFAAERAATISFRRMEERSGPINTAANSHSGSQQSGSQRPQRVTIAANGNGVLKAAAAPHPPAAQTSSSLCVIL